MSTPEVKTGDDWKFKIVFKDSGGNPIDLTNYATVKCGIVSTDDSNTTELVAGSPLDSGETGADFPNGIAIYKVARTTTVNITWFGDAWLEPQLELNSPDEHTSPERGRIHIKKGIVV